MRFASQSQAGSFLRDTWARTPSLRRPLGFGAGCRISPLGHLEASVWGFNCWFWGSAARSIILDAPVSVSHWSPVPGTAGVSNSLPSTSLEPQHWCLIGSPLILAIRLKVQTWQAGTCGISKKMPGMQKCILFLPSGFFGTQA